MIIHEVEQGTEEWHALRAGKPTASEFSKLVTSVGAPSKSLEGYAIQLAADAIAGEPVDRWQGNEWTERGHEMEDRARSYYRLEYPNRAVTEVGFITDDLERWGASPDSMVDANDGGGTISEEDFGMLEIKCQKGSKHIETIMYYDKHGKMPPAYVQQTQGQMFVAGRAWNDLLFWHPDLPALLIRSHPDEEFVAGLTQQLETVMDRRDDIMAMLERIAN